ncbi:MAG: hypothetical protein ACFNUS_02255 [Candidatus Saccharimonas sp.]|nr:hypothetical protein G112A_00122 [Candidatus Nanosynsacchari sp. TM7_G1_3_12Alb]
MSHEQNVGKSEKKLITAAAIGLSAAVLTGCGVGDYGASSAETPNPAAIAEQEAVDLVGEYREHPEKFDESAIVRVEVPEGSSVNGAATAYVDQYGQEQGWTGPQHDLEHGVVNKAAAEISVVPHPGTEVIMYHVDLNGDGTVDITPVGVENPTKQ